MTKVTKKEQKEAIKVLKDLIKVVEIYGQFDEKWEDFDKAIIVLNSIRIQADLMVPLMIRSGHQAKQMREVKA